MSSGMFTLPAVRRLLKRCDYLRPAITGPTARHAGFSAADRHYCLKGLVGQREGIANELIGEAQQAAGCLAAERPAILSARAKIYGTLALTILRNFK